MSTGLDVDAEGDVDIAASGAGVGAELVRFVDQRFGCKAAVLACGACLTLDGLSIKVS